MCELVIGKIRKENRGSSEKNSAMEGRGNLILGDGKENIVFFPQFLKNISFQSCTSFLCGDGSCDAKRF